MKVGIVGGMGDIMTAIWQADTGQLISGHDPILSLDPSFNAFRKTNSTDQPVKLCGLSF